MSTRTRPWLLLLTALAVLLGRCDAWRLASAAAAAKKVTALPALPAQQAAPAATATTEAAEAAAERAAAQRQLQRASTAAATALAAGAVLCCTPLEAQLLAAHAANMPEATGASGTKRGTAEALRPIEDMRGVLERARAESAKGRDLQLLSAILSELPREEKLFKRVFDEYSNGISYKQQYLNNNAFVIYYSQGFDGVGRASIETESADEAKQKAQYGYRNEAWIALDDCRAELDYLVASGPSESRKDLDSALLKALQSVEAYLSLAAR